VVELQKKMASLFERSVIANVSDFNEKIITPNDDWYMLKGDETQTSLNKVWVGNVPAFTSRPQLILRGSRYRRYPNTSRLWVPCDTRVRYDGYCWAKEDIDQNSTSSGHPTPRGAVFFPHSTVGGPSEPTTWFNLLQTERHSITCSVAGWSV